MAGDHETSVGGAGDWPGRSAGLSSREAEVLALIARGLTNLEVAERAHLSINSIKSYIRSAYRKIGVQRRPQAILWALENGFVPDKERKIDPALQVRPAVATGSVAVPTHTKPSGT
jgi:DNA-binding CsgD family transcriptional regulator